jgi:hypothetical protein
MRTKFDINLLNKFSNENDIEIIGHYEKLNRQSIINGKCKTNDCKCNFSKAFRTLFDNKSFYCEKCTTQIKVNKILETTMKNNGVMYSLKCQKIFEKMKKTNMKKYGVEYNSQIETVKIKKAKTFLKKYGVEHPSQNSEIAEKISKNAYKSCDYIFPSGKVNRIQGYEHYALGFLLNNENINEDDIITGCKNVPTIWYNDENGKKHRHYVDIFIPSQNKCIEVKSTWTAEKKKDCIFLKQNAGKDLGYKYEIWVYDGKGNIVNKYL